MKVFVYSKKDNSKIAMFNNVVAVKERKGNGTIVLTTSELEEYLYYTAIVKTCIYQN